MNDVYIGLGRAQGVRRGDYFLAYNATVRAIAILKVASTQDRMSVVTTLAQIASLRKGDRVKRISPARAKTLQRHLMSLVSTTPDLAADVIADPALVAASQAIGAPNAAAAAGAMTPDLSGVVLMAKANAGKIDLSWPAPTTGAELVRGYRIYRTTRRTELGTSLTPVPLTVRQFVDGNIEPNINYVYRLTAITAAGAEAPIAPSIEVTYTPRKKGTFGIGGSPEKVAAKALPAFSIAGVPALTIPPAPTPTSASPIPPTMAVAPPPAPMAPAPPPTPASWSADAAPDLSDVILMATATKKGVHLAWPTPTKGEQGIAGYVVYRTADPTVLGDRITPTPVTKLEFLDKNVPANTPQVYRITAMGTEGIESASAPSIEVTYTPRKKGTLGIGGDPAKVSARNLPAFVLSGGTAVAGIAAPTIPGVGATPGVGTAPAVPPAPALPPAPAPSPAPGEVATPPLPAAAPVPPAADTGVAEAPPAEEEAEPATYVPSAPRKVSVTLEGSTVVVKWNPVSSKPAAVAGYIVYRGTPGTGTGKALNDTPTKKTVFRDRKAEGGRSYDYWVVTRTVEGGTSAPSKKINVDVPKSGSVVPFF